MKPLLTIALIALLTGCAQAPAIQQGPDAETTFDGLVRIDNARFSNAWIDPDVDLTQYNKIIVADAVFEFRAVRRNSSSSMARRSGETEFWINDDQQASLIEIVSTAFRGELARSENFTAADAPGPDVLVIVGALHDIVSNVPPDMIGRGETFLSSVGEATLVLEARDSLSGETIYRAIDRRSAERAGGSMTVSNTVTTRAEVRRLAQRWASRLRAGLDSIHD